MITTLSLFENMWLGAQAPEGEGVYWNYGLTTQDPLPDRPEDFFAWCPIFRPNDPPGQNALWVFVNEELHQWVQCHRKSALFVIDRIGIIDDQDPSLHYIKFRVWEEPWPL